MRIADTRLLVRIIKFLSQGLMMIEIFRIYINAKVHKKTNVSIPMRILFNADKIGTYSNNRLGLSSS